jgi:hypothetical protein
MRVVAIVFILLSVGANFYYNNITSLVLAMFSFPVLIWLLVKKKKRAMPGTTVPEKQKQDARPVE